MTQVYVWKGPCATKTHFFLKKKKGPIKFWAWVVSQFVLKFKFHWKMPHLIIGQKYPCDLYEYLVWFSCFQGISFSELIPRFIDKLFCSIPNLIKRILKWTVTISLLSSCNKKVFARLFSCSMSLSITTVICRGGQLTYPLRFLWR